jgi:hypothetical protein
MKADLPDLWAATPSSLRREPTNAELAGGFPCGPLDLPLFNELTYRLSQVYRESAYAITQSGQTPNAGNTTQLWAAMQASATSIVTNNFAKGSLIARRVFSTPGTQVYTPTTGTKKIRATVVGGGGGGGGVQGTTASQFSVAGGGGGGGVAISDLATGFSGVNITVGAGGSGGTGATQGGTGGTSSFGVTLAATGGLGGTFTSPALSVVVQAGGPGGTATGGNVTNGVGGAGANGVGTSNVNAASGQGGDSAIGSGASAVFTSSVPGLPGTSPGSGGSGACSLSNQSGFVGGAGANGVVIIEEYA